MEQNIKATIRHSFESVVVKAGRIDLEAMGIKGPTSTRTYMVHDGTEGLSLLGGIGEFAAAFSAPLYMMNVLLQWIQKKKRT